LLYDVVDLGDDMAFAFTIFIGVGNNFCDAERVSVKGCLRYEAIGERDSEKASDASRKSKEEEVPVEARRFSEGKLGALGNQR
jgi:hypothetical protein